MAVTPTNTIYHEPAQIAQGDTVSFTRQLPLYPASAGWSLLYAMRGNGQQIQFTSTANGDDHVILVAAAITETWLPADYVLEGWAVFTDGTRNGIYKAQLKVTPDLATAPGDVPVTTHAQRMLAGIETQLEKMALNVLDMTDVEGTRIQRAKRMELYQMRAHYLRERQGEIARDRARAGLPTGRKIKTVLRITPPVMTGANQFGAGNSVYNTNFP